MESSARVIFLSLAFLLAVVVFLPEVHAKRPKFKPGPSWRPARATSNGGSDGSGTNGLSEVQDEKEFDYIKGSKRGPEHWGELKKEWATCKTGKMQSPIDLLHRRVEMIPKSEEITKLYKPTKAHLKNRGHDIEIKWGGEDSKIQINGTDYILRQCHWHSPSEHTINGKRLASEVHMVHESLDNKIAVIGLLYKIGKPDPFLSKLIMKKIESVSNTSEEIDAGIINPPEIKMAGGKYYRYVGSLTTPPCTEGVLWTVNKKIATISEEQVAFMRKSVHDHAKENARPVQPLNGRNVHLYTKTLTKAVDSKQNKTKQKRLIKAGKSC